MEMYCDYAHAHPKLLKWPIKVKYLPSNHNPGYIELYCFHFTFVNVRGYRVCRRRINWLNEFGSKTNIKIKIKKRLPEAEEEKKTKSGITTYTCVNKEVTVVKYT